LRPQQVFALAVALQLKPFFGEGLLEHLSKSFQLLKEEAIDKFLGGNGLNA
jgi:hypothetical protein